MQSFKPLAALTVLYHPTDPQLHRVVSLAQRCACVLVVDNTPDADLQRATLLQGAGVQYLHHGNLGGIAGALNRGLSHLFAQSFDAVVLLDQDSELPDDYFSVMQAECDGRQGDAFMLGPVIYEPAVGACLPVLRVRRLLFQVLALNKDSPTEPCSFLITSGSVVSRQAYLRLGRFDEALLIDHVDTEYCLRARQLNVPVFVVPRLVMRHQIGVKARHQVGPVALTAMNHSPSRRYYFVRNAVHLVLRRAWHYPIVSMLLMFVVFTQLLAVCLFEADKRKKLNCMRLGLLDGLAGRLGTLDHNRPDLAIRLQGRA